MFTGLKLFEIPLWVLVISLVFFSRGILIFLTIFCLVLAQGPFLAIQLVATNLRWVFLILFAFHVFGDGFLGRAVRKIKTFDVSAFLFISYALLSIFYSPYPSLTLERATTVLLLYFSVFWVIWKYAYDQGPEKVVYLLLKATMLVFIISYLMLFIRPSDVFMYARFQGIFQSPNSI
ncbi:MAG: hypothetical protein NT066_06200, partial [Candidatus Omnitrophica bacterium]|nr:hypothetical protein [Candidatus Omnitrophota bacterium]